MKALMLLALAAVCALPCLARPGSTWRTEFESSGGKRTPRYRETIDYCKRLDRASPWVRYRSFGVSPQGRELPLVILSKEGAFAPAQAARTGKVIILVQSCIHAGEPDGKDASLMLMRDVAVAGRSARLLDHAILLFVPIFNVDGHERFGPYTRINQNGPEEAGWRVTAQNLNLNRDYMKADAPEMRAMLRLFADWLPDLYVDCHVTDGMDFQYDITYAVEHAANIDAAVSRWVRQTLVPGVLPRVVSSGYAIFPYVAPREDNDLSSGLNGGAAPPRFSTGYAAVQNRPAFLIETHMLKPYKMRVEGTYAVLQALIETVGGSYRELTRAVRRADASTVDAGKRYDARRNLPLRLQVGDSFVMKDFSGVRSFPEPSPVSGGVRTVYTGEPVQTSVRYYGEAVVTDSVVVPLAYIIPPEWTRVREVIKAHSIRIRVLKKDLAVDVESYRFSDVAWQSRSYEGRHPVTYTARATKERRVYRAGSLVVPMDQRAARVAVHLLEPGSPDALVSWGFFDTIFEQKEYAEEYVMERIGAEMLRDNAKLKKEFEEKVSSDSAFAASPSVRLRWLYNRSPWADPLLNIYPVGRIVDVGAMQECRQSFSAITDR